MLFKLDFLSLSGKCLNGYFFRQMSEAQNPDWLLLPDLVFDKVMWMIGLSCLETLDTCRQVCTTWNVILMRKLWENPSKSWGKIIRKRIENCWGLMPYLPSDEKVSLKNLTLGTYINKIKAYLDFFV